MEINKAEHPRRALDRERTRERYWADVEKSRAYTRAWRAANPEKVRAYVRKWKVLNPEKVRSANRRKLPTPTRPEPEICELCGGFSLRTMHLDHDHRSGTFRGWLCSFCNTGLGLFFDDPDRLRRAIVYLERAVRV